MAGIVQNRAGLAIAFIVAGICAISINDMFVKQLSGGYPLHEIVFARSGIGMIFSLIFVQMEGGWRILKTSEPGLHILRGALIVVANMTFFLAVAAMPLADATALFFVAPLFITLLSIPILGEKVGPVRLTAVAIGFVGVLIMQRPWQDADTLEVSRIVLLLPVFAALTYALNQLMTRKLGARAKASALAVYIQLAFVVGALGFYLVAGDGRYLPEDAGPSATFLLRTWTWPETSTDLWIFAGLGCNGAIVGYCLSQAYRLADAATVAPFEYLGLPLSVFWGLMIFGDLPVLEVWIGILLILSSGLFVFVREQQKARHLARRELAGRH